MKSVFKAMISKDIKEVVSSKQTFIPMIIVPLVIMVIMPLIMIVGAQYGVSTMNGMDNMMKLFGSKMKDLNNTQIIIEIALNYMFPVLFLLIPVMASSIIGASSFVGEKEHKTIESVLYTPVSIRQIFISKVYGTALPALGITLFTAIVFGIIMNIGGMMYFHHLIFPNLRWLILIFWVSPAVTILAIFFMVLVSAKAKTFQDAQQMSIFIILPVIFLLFGQLGGLFVLNELFLAGFGAIVFVVDYILMKKATQGFSPEKLI